MHNTIQGKLIPEYVISNRFEMTKAKTIISRSGKRFPEYFISYRFKCSQRHLSSGRRRNRKEKEEEKR